MWGRTECQCLQSRSSTVYQIPQAGRLFHAPHPLAAGHWGKGCCWTSHLHQTKNKNKTNPSSRSPCSVDACGAGAWRRSPGPCCRPCAVGRLLALLRRLMMTTHVRLRPTLEGGVGGGLKNGRSRQHWKRCGNTARSSSESESAARDCTLHHILKHWLWQRLPRMVSCG